MVFLASESEGVADVGEVLGDGNGVDIQHVDVVAEGQLQFELVDVVRVMKGHLHTLHVHPLSLY